MVKESLTDGTVIQDMELNGKILSQPLDVFPPLFREELGYLRNHGELTLEPPPALAYGEAGYPPTIPPNAPVVYALRIESNVPPAGKPPADELTSPDTRSAAHRRAIFLYVRITEEAAQ